MNWKKGFKYLCVNAKSPGYRVGEEYECVVDDKRNLCLKARDGFLDPVNLLVSKFRVVKIED